MRATASASNGASEQGIYTLFGVCDVVLSVTTANFDKSMTTHADYRIWQDVYKVVNQNGSDITSVPTLIEQIQLVTRIGRYFVLDDFTK